ncbi:hypothetical protein [Virgibacillus necropolis]|uniref:DUF4878 domain-containing protein n=1 Tax=Virgibacillus necropolis TaxID=163877 RepID=A0A221MA40_9BACI|nr:hypothetical protein [Virgibacillus necropolis]ASN04507.1 hypothetical protein CFK40_05520 [Virgibacillus necropolis]
MRKSDRGTTLLIVLLFTVVTAAITIYYLFFFSKPPGEQAVEVVDTFYTYEQDGAFSDSWAMFHPLMKEKFPKGHYLQDRAHIFMNHFGVTTFTYTLSEAMEVKNWKIEKGAEPIPTTYMVTVTQVYKGKYGNFSIVQDLYTTIVDGEWKVLWDYKK